MPVQNKVTKTPVPKINPKNLLINLNFLHYVLYQQADENLTIEEVGGFSAGIALDVLVLYGLCL
jgi:hypothetical protein